MPGDRYQWTDMPWLESITLSNGKVVPITPPSAAPVVAAAPLDHVDELHRLAMQPDAHPDVQGLSANAQIARRLQGK